MSANPMNRFRTARVEWARLDNASKIFPATSNNKDTKVFRLTCELFETVKPEILQQALNETVENFPLHRSILRRGVFWYYLETSDIQPIVEIESNPHTVQRFQASGLAASRRPDKSRNAV